MSSRYAVSGLGFSISSVDSRAVRCPVLLMAITERYGSRRLVGRRIGTVSSSLRSVCSSLGCPVAEMR